MPTEMPLDVQWLVYALVSNQALTAEDAVALWQAMPEGDGLAEFAQEILNRLSEGLSEEESRSLLDQLQELVEYAAAQAESGAEPPFDEEDGEYEEDAEDEPEAAEDFGAAGGIATAGTIQFNGCEIDISEISSFEELPSLADMDELSDEELGQRVVMLLACLRKLGCSDLHLTGGGPAFVRRQLEIRRIDDHVITPEQSKRLNTVLLTPERLRIFEEEQDTNFALSIGHDRFRVCLMVQREGVSGSYRLIPDHICSLEELGFLSDDCITIRRLLDYNNGLVLVAGPIGAGKTTTLATLADIINEKRRDHIISVEDPIEIVQSSRNCQVSQREIGRDTKNYHSALKAALREDPDVIIIGEMNDLETIENAITAAETGHLVIGTLPTGDAANTLNRLLDVFPPMQQPQIRAMTSGSLRGVLCQKLIPDGFGGIAVIYEILVNTMAVANLISEGKAFQLHSTMSIGSKAGMCTYDQCLLAKFDAGLITYEVAMEHMQDAPVKAQLNALWAAKEKAREAAAKKRRK